MVRANSGTVNRCDTTIHWKVGNDTPDSITAEVGKSYQYFGTYDGPFCRQKESLYLQYSDGHVDCIDPASNRSFERTVSFSQKTGSFEIKLWPLFISCNSDRSYISQSFTGAHKVNKKREILFIFKPQGKFVRRQLNYTIIKQQPNQ